MKHKIDGNGYWQYTCNTSESKYASANHPFREEVGISIEEGNTDMRYGPITLSSLFDTRLLSARMFESRIRAIDLTSKEDVKRFMISEAIMILKTVRG